MLNIKKLIKGLRLLSANDQTKALEITPSDASTTNTKTTISVAQTANRTLTIPTGSASEEILTQSATQLVSNKTLVVANNTVTTAPSGNLAATELNSALAELQADIDTRATIVQLNDHINDPTAAHAASAISNIPAGNLSATDIQAAVDELQSDIDTRATNTDLNNHITDVSDAHDASAISVVPAGNLLATDVQAALEELQLDVDSKATNIQLNDHLTDAVDAHDASAISNVPLGNLTATDVQAALNELQSEIDGLSFGAGANQTLSNLTSPVAINQDLLPNSSGTRLLGSDTLKFSNSWVSQQANSNRFAITPVVGSLATAFIREIDNANSPDGVSIGGAILDNNTTRVGIATQNFGDNGTNTRDIILATGNKTAGAAASGNITLRTGTVATGTRGTINLINASLAGASVGHVWTLQNTSTGAGVWSAPSVPAVNLQSAVITSYANSTSSYTTAATVVFTSTGRPCEWGLYHDTGPVGVLSVTTIGAATAVQGYLRLFNSTSATSLSERIFGTDLTASPGIGYTHFGLPGSLGIVTIPAGTYTLLLEGQNGASNVRLNISNMKFYIREL